jgi:ABC-type dipeptide/oligopeptide/nickel transport system permease subunit
MLDVWARKLGYGSRGSAAIVAIVVTISLVIGFLGYTYLTQR